MSYYSAGTISVTNGSTAVTGVLTTFNANVKPGDTLWLAGVTAVVAAVVSNTSLTLAFPWTGSTLSGQASYLINHTGDGWFTNVTTNESLAALITMLEGSTFLTGDGSAWADPITLASAATTDVLGAASYFVNISGTATITLLGSAANRFRIVKALGAFTLVHNGTSLLLPGSANMIAAAGDSFIVTSDELGNATVANYSRAAADLTGISGLGASIAAAATTNLDAATGDALDITGNTTITAITLAAGRKRWVRFTGTPLLTHSANLDLPDAANIQAAVGDRALFVGYGSGVTRLINYEHYNRKGTDVAAAATLNLDAVAGDMVDVTGNTGITAVTLAQGRMMLVRFTGTPIITAGASLILPAPGNIQAVAGDQALFRGYAAGVVRLVSYQRLTGKALVASALTDLLGGTYVDKTLIRTSGVGGALQGSGVVVNDTDDVTLRSVKSALITLADDTAVAFNVPNGGNGILGIISHYGGGGGSVQPNGMFWGRGGNPACIAVAPNPFVGNVNFSTAVLAGTTGTDGFFTISCPSGGTPRFMFENRTGASTTFIVLIIG